MRARPSRSVVVLAVLGLAVVSCDGRSLAAEKKVDLSGKWALNDSLSDNPMEKMREGASGGRGYGGSEGGGRGGGFGGGRGGMGGRGGGFGGGGRGEGGGRGGDGGAPPAEVVQNVSHLVITQSDPELRIRMADGKERLLYTDCRKVEEERSEGTVKIKTRMKSDKVVVTSDFPSGRDVTETYEIQTIPKRLVVTTKVEARRGSFSFKRIYDPEIEAPAP
jgi:hypothetical protein